MAKFYNIYLFAFHMKATLVKHCLDNKTMGNIIDLLAEYPFPFLTKVCTERIRIPNGHKHHILNTFFHKNTPP